MNKHQLAYLKSIGTPQSIIDILAATKDEDTVDLAAHVEAFKNTQRSLFENDPDLVKKIQSEAVGKLTGVLDRKIKSAFNLSPEVTKDKTVEELITIAKTESAKGLDKPLQDLQNEIVTLNTKIKQYEEEILPAERAKVDSTIGNFKKEAILNKLISGKKLRVPLDAALPAIQSYLGNKYDVELNADGTDIIIYQKGTKLQVKSADATSLLTADEIISNKLKENQFIAESNADDVDPATGKTRVIVNPDPLKKPDNKIKVAHLSEAEKYLEEIKAADAKAAAERKANV